MDSNKQFSTISKKLIFKIVAFSTVVTFIITALQLQREYNASIKGLHHHLGQVAKIVVPEMTYNVWHLDENAIRLQLSAMINLVDFDFVELKFDREVISFGDKTKFSNKKVQVFDLKSNFKGSKHSLGTLKIVTNLNPYIQNIIDKAFVILLSNGIKTFILVFFMYYVFNRSILIHLNHISTELSTMNLKSLKSKLHLSREDKDYNDELDIVVNSINDLHVSIINEVEAAELAREEKEELQEMLAQSQKMEALGRLAGGIAHDFNNILHVIIGSVEQAKSYLQNQDADKVKKYLADIMRFSEKADHMIKQILTYTHQKKVSFTILNLTEVFEESIEMVQSTLPANISLEFNVEDDYYIYGDRTQLNQLIFNFCTNARDAIGEGLGFICINIKREPNTNRIVISIEDNGQGLEENIKEKIFDPYFSTKAVNKGTGMGLSIIHAIVEKMSGYIWVESKVGQGTQFYIVLPESKDSVVSTKELQEEKHEIIDSNSIDSRTFLILDDESEIASLHRDILVKKGSKAHMYTDPLKALDDLKNGLEVDMMLVDLSMPILTGIEFAKFYKENGGTAPIIILTGHEEIILTDEEMKDLNISEILLKPISRKVLLKSLGFIS
jgi:signal transduction histidine kinase/CheY-like chemotaxis protein